MAWVLLAKTGIAVVCLVWLCLASSARAQQSEGVHPLQQAYVLWQQGYILHFLGRL